MQIFEASSCRLNCLPYPPSSWYVSLHLGWRLVMKRRLCFFSTTFMLSLFASATSFAQRPELVVQTGHSEYILASVFSPDGKVLASASFDTTIKLWSAASSFLSQGVGIAALYRCQAVNLGSGSTGWDKRQIVIMQKQSQTNLVHQFRLGK